MEATFAIILSIIGLILVIVIINLSMGALALVIATTKPDYMNAVRECWNAKRYISAIYVSIVGFCSNVISVPHIGLFIVWAYIRGFISWWIILGCIIADVILIHVFWNRFSK